ncbi:MAG: hypothetical protein QXI19_14990 [Candidatus Caldarchaeum sp.]
MDDREAHLLAERLRRYYWEKSDLLLVQEGQFPVVERIIDLSIPRAEPELIYDGRYGVGVFIQTISAFSALAKCTLRINRLDGPTYNPIEERIYVGEPIRKLWITNEPTQGHLKIRIHTNPAYILAISPTEESLLQAVYALHSSGVSGQLSVTTSGTNLPDIPVPNGGKVRLWASKNNTGEIAINLQSMPTVGVHAGLDAGESLEIQVTNTNIVYVIASASTQKLNYLVLT